MGKAISPRRQSQRVKNKPYKFADAHDKFYSSKVNTTSLVFDFVKYDEKAGVFRKCTDISDGASNRQKQKQTLTPSRPRPRPRIKKHAKAKRPSRRVNAKTKKGGKCPKVTDIPLWGLHVTDKSSAIEKIQRILSSSSKLKLHLKNKSQSKSKSIATQLGAFFLFCHERQCIWIKRKRNMPRPWTEDEILSKKHFTNLYRELDAGTVYFRRAMIVKRAEVSEACKCRYSDDFEYAFTKEVLWASICYRILCRVEVFQELGGIPTREEWPKFFKKLERHKKKGNTIFTGAYQTMGLAPLEATMKKLSSEKVLIDDLAQIVLNAGENYDLQTCTDSIATLPYIGKFYAWQVTCDLMECGVLKDVQEADALYVKLGPGAEGGLKCIFGDTNLNLKIKNEYDNKDAYHVGLCILLRDWQEHIFDALGVKFERFDNRPMSLKVLEHALCEFYKYIHATRGSSKAPRLYKGGSNGNGAVVSIESNICANISCQANVNASFKVETNSYSRSRCDTCWRPFCRECRSSSAKNTSKGQLSPSWICADCRELSTSLSSKEQEHVDITRYHRKK